MITSSEFSSLLIFWDNRNEQNAQIAANIAASDPTTAANVDVVSKHSCMQHSSILGDFPGFDGKALSARCARIQRPAGLYLTAIRPIALQTT